MYVCVFLFFHLRWEWNVYLSSFLISQTKNWQIYLCLWKRREMFNLIWWVCQMTFFFTFDHFHLNFLYFILFFMLVFVHPPAPLSLIFFFGSFVCTIPLLWSLILISSHLVWFSSSDFLLLLASLYLREHFFLGENSYFLSLLLFFTEFAVVVVGTWKCVVKYFLLCVYCNWIE